MAKWNKNKVDPDNLHGGQEFVEGDNLAIDELNAIVNNSFYASEKAQRAEELSESAVKGNGTLVTINGQIQGEWSADFAEGERLKTLNLFNPKNHNRINSLSSISTNVEDNFIKVTTDKNYGNTRVQYLALDLTNYVGKTLYFKCKYSTSSTNDTKVNFWLANSVNDFSTLITTTNTTTGSGDFNLSFVVPSDLSSGKYLLIMFYSAVSNKVKGFVEFTDIILSTEDISYISYNGAIVNENQVADVEHIEVLYDMNNENKQIFGDLAYTNGLLPGDYTNLDFKKYKYLKVYLSAGYRGAILFIDLNTLNDSHYFGTGMIGADVIPNTNLSIQYFYSSVNSEKNNLRFATTSLIQGTYPIENYTGAIISKIEGVY